MKALISLGLAGGFAFILSNTMAARADEITVLASNGVKSAVVELAPQFEKETGHRLAFSWGASNLLVKQIEDGTAFDVVIVSPALIKNLIQEGKVVEGSAVDLARIGIGVAMKQGAPKPDISTVQAFKETLLNAKAIAYTSAGLSGRQFMSIAVKLGIGEQVRVKSKIIPDGAAAELVAKGEADIAIQLIPELASVSGIEIVGPLPPDIQTYIVLTGGVGTNAKDKAAGQAFIKYLTTPAAISVIKSKRMEPG